MGTAKILVFFIVIALIANIAYSFSTNSSNYKLFPQIVSSGGEIANSSSYKSYSATGIIAGITNSSTYKTLLGFFYAWLLADGQPCTANNQCEGGYCCSNLCQSSACPSEAPGPGGGGGGAPSGGGGGGYVNASVITKEKEKKDFSVSQSSIKEKLALGESSEKTLGISNTGNTEISVSLDVEGVENFMFLSDSSISLDAGESGSIMLNFIAKRVGAFVGQIIAAADGIMKPVPVILEVITEKVLFDVKLDIPSAYSTVSPGDTLKSQITLLNVGAPEKVDVFATYLIKDLRSNVIYEESETFAVEKQVSFQKSFKIPSSIELGKYVLIMEVRYADSFAVSSQLFEVGEKKSIIEEAIRKNSAVMMFLFLILVGFVFLLAYSTIVRKKAGKGRK